MIIGDMEAEAALSHITSKLLKNLPWAQLACLQTPFLKAEDTLPILIVSFCPNFFLHRSLLPNVPLFPPSNSPLFPLPILLPSRKWLSREHCLDNVFPVEGVHVCQGVETVSITPPKQNVTYVCENPPVASVLCVQDYAPQKQFTVPVCVHTHTHTYNYINTHIYKHIHKYTHI